MNIFQRFILIPAQGALEKARRSARLVQRDITLTNKDGTTYRKRVWVLPSEAKTEKPRAAQFDLFDGGAPAAEEPKLGIEKPRVPTPAVKAASPKLDGKFQEWKKDHGDLVLSSADVTKCFETSGPAAKRYMEAKVAAGEAFAWNNGRATFYALTGTAGEAKLKERKAAGDAKQARVDSLARKLGDLVERKKAEKEASPEDAKRCDLSLSIEETPFRDYGSWGNKGKHLNPAARAKLNQEVAELLLKPRDELSAEDIEKVRRYSGFGGVKADDERGVLYDFFTSPPVAKMTWKMLDKIAPIAAGESVLEPSCGTGVFFEVAPEGLDLHGVELDKRTAAAASVLQEGAAIHSGSFEQFNLCNERQFSRVVGNAPFGDRSVLTSFMDMPEEKSLDRYFLSRSLDALADGGSMALIVHPGVMDGKGNREWRAEMLKKGQFMGAARLPNGSFKHTQTGVQPDIIFFRKYPEETRQRLAQLDEKGLKAAGFWNEAWVDGSYYKEKPEHILGAFAEGAGNWGRDVVEGELSLADMDAAAARFEPEADMTVEDLDRLRSMTKKPAEAPKKKAEELALTEGEAEAVAAKTLTVGATKSVDGRVYRLNANHRWERVKGADEVAAEKLERVKAIAEAVKGIRDAMRADEPVDDLQREARRLLQAYEEAYGVAPREDKDIRKVLNANAALAGVYEGLVGIDDDLLTKQNVYAKEIEIVDGHNPAVTALLTLQRNMIEATPKQLRAYFPNDFEGLKASLQECPDAFLTPEGAWQLREDFIAGNAWDKVDALRKAIEKHPGEKFAAAREKWQHGVDELEKAVGWVPIEEAEFTPQSSWIPEELIDQWARDGNGMDFGYAFGEFHLARNEEGKWGVVYDEDKYIRGKNWREAGHTIAAGDWQDYNHELVYFLNMQKQRSSRIDTETFNRNAEDNFKNWVSNNPEVRKQLEELYNRKFNAEIGAPTKTYAVKIDGWSPKIVLGGHQWQSIHHLYRAGKGITALGTGFGKTLAAIGLIGLLRQEGKVKRPMIQVPNNKVKDWIKEIAKAMPGLKVGAVDPETEGYSNQVKRYKMYQDLANGDFDVIVLPESAASEIQLRPEEDQRITDDIVAGQIMDKVAAKSSRKVEQAKETARGKLEAGKTNQTINFEDFGCDALFVDEAHNYKNLFSSSLSRETGMNDGRRSDRAMSLFKKSEFIRRGHDGKNVFLLTATPLTNSPLEYYNMLMHIAPEELDRLNIRTIDDFIRNFADIEVQPKCDWGTGKTIDAKVLKGFKNLRTLQDMFFKYTDLQNDPTKIGLPKPKANNNPNVIPMQEDQTGVLRDLSAQLEEFKSLGNDEKAEKYPGQNFLTFYSRMRTASLDLELYNPSKYAGWKNPKLSKLAENAMESFKATGGGQVVFCDRVLSGDGSFNMHDKIKAALVAQGFKDSEIVVVNGITKAGGKKSDTALEKEVSAAIDGYNSGKYKVIIGTTPTLGEGVNLQDNSAALHHFDIPYRPSDFIQRNGRIDRQGNKQAAVALNTYLTAGTIDNYSVNLVQNKANWIDQLLRTKSNVFTNPNDDSFVDPDELLLALTEEWGDKEKANERRAEMEKIKTGKIKEANAQKVHETLAALSLMRGSIRGFEGDKGTVQYQNRLRKLYNMEEALRNNPEFQNLELLKDNPPDFIYDKAERRVYKPGDLFMMRSGPFVAMTINHKKQTMLLKPVSQEGGGWTSDWVEWKQGSGDHWTHVANPTKKDVAGLKSLYAPADFAQQAEAFKRDRYRDMLQYSPDRETRYCKVNAEGKVEIASKGWSFSAKDAREALNPYVAEDRARIIAAVRSGEAEADGGAINDPVFEQTGIAEALKEPAMKAYRAHKEAEYIDSMASTYWKPVEDIVERMKRRGLRGASAYELHDIIEMNPDYEVEYNRTHGGRAGYAFRKRPKMEKSMRMIYRNGPRLGIMRKEG